MKKDFDLIWQREQYFDLKRGNFKSIVILGTTTVNGINLLQKNFFSEWGNIYLLEGILLFQNVPTYQEEFPNWIRDNSSMDLSTEVGDDFEEMATNFKNFILSQLGNTNLFQSFLQYIKLTNFVELLSQTEGKKIEDNK